MPTYQYACTDPACDHRFELVQSFTDPAASECPVCGHPVRKVYSAVGVVFKGSGFYRTDSRDSAKGSLAASGSGDSGGSSEGSSSKDSGSGKSAGDSSSAPSTGSDSSSAKSGSGAKAAPASPAKSAPAAAPSKSA